MDSKKVERIMEDFEKSTLNYFEYKDSEMSLVLSKDGAPKQEGSTSPSLSSQTLEGNPYASIEEEPSQPQVGQVLSPMVGTVYLQADPETPPYVEVGSQVEEGQVICIIEAMKIMNEIKAPHSGTVREILVESEEVVEYNQALFTIN